MKMIDTLNPGDTVYTVLRHVSKSGMIRDISLYIIRDNEPLNITWHVADRLKMNVKNNGIRIKGCGMDMGFHLVYGLGSALWPDGTDRPHGIRNGVPDSEGGYALKQRWL